MKDTSYLPPLQKEGMQRRFVGPTDQLLRWTYLAGGALPPARMPLDGPSRGEGTAAPAVNGIRHAQEFFTNASPSISFHGPISVQTFAIALRFGAN